ncbi:LPS export ABC transporter periplasmic protein LptC [Marivita hallyeonensis]|uniref:Lipopolysaccharide export system protein LptC n=1 Tax=Marivita hallyeonensis TaxID=996342 RepID=A0A1M5TLL2_9RHOB|nr:LPS export ABC transporter periplasmic protein LptC [Marivita hallyeonensis]SHH51647.1 lipopolysaccharide export system protein LptC [Marivita hallyeonensis]
MYSRLIAWLKILLPLGALALLSTIFLYSRSPDPISTIPVLANGVDPSQNEQVGSPFYAGTTDGGHALTLAARQARVVAPGQEGMVADDLRATLDTEDGSRITIDATLGRMDDTDRLLLRDGVVLQSSSGYTVRTDGLDAAIDRVEIDSTGPVDADGPGLVLTAGRLRVEEIAETSDIQLLFTDGVKLVYTPQNAEAQE